MARRLSILIGGASNTTDYDDVLKKAKLGGTMPWGTRTKELHQGETVLIYIARPHSKLVAKAKVLKHPKKAAPGDYAYRVEIGSFKLLPNQVALNDLRGQFKKWNWLRQPRAAVAVPKEFSAKLWSLIHSNPPRNTSERTAKILISNAGKGLRRIKEQASGGPPRFWSVPKYTCVGDTVFFYVITPEKAILAKGTCLTAPRTTHVKWCEAKIGEVQLLDRPVKLKELRRMFREWKWLRSVTMFGYMTPEQSRQLLKRCNVEVSNGSLNQQSESELHRTIENLHASDRRREVLQRTEQSLLRKHLFGNASTERCGICDRDFPVNLLVAAHIKPRFQCTSKERNDYRNNVMPMCKFGCDDLFEKSYITVRNGIVTSARASGLHMTPVKNYLKAITGLQCRYWRQRSAFYFNWHNKKR